MFVHFSPHFLKEEKGGKGKNGKTSVTDQKEAERNKQRGLMKTDMVPATTHAKGSRTELASSSDIPSPDP